MPSIYYKNFQPNPAGQLLCGGSTPSTIRLNYSYTNVTTNLRIYRDQAVVHIIQVDPSGTGNGFYEVQGLAANLPYTFVLIHGNNVREQELSRATCSTTAPPPQEPPPPPPTGRASYPISTFSHTQTVVIETTGATTFIFAAGAGNTTINGNPGTQYNGQTVPGGRFSIVKVNPDIHVCLTVTADSVQRIS